MTGSRVPFFAATSRTVLNVHRSATTLPIKKVDTFNSPGRSRCLLSICDWGPFRLPSRSLPRHPAASRKRNTTSAHRHRNQARQHHAYSGTCILLRRDRQDRKKPISGKINAKAHQRRKINFISYDDGYSPPKTVEQPASWWRANEVLLIFNSLAPAELGDPEIT